MMHYTENCQKGKFETTLFGCTSDCGLFCYVLFCYPCAEAEAWATVRDEQCTCTHTKGSEIFIRANIRKIRNMPNEFCCDNIINMFCTVCTVTQDIREIKRIKDECREFEQKSNLYYNNNYNVQNPESYLEPNMKSPN